MRRTFYPDIALLFAVALSLLCSSLHAQTYRILPLGNSITQGMGEEYIAESDRISYRKKLYELLSAGGYDFDLVGHRNAGYGLFPDADHGGIPGTRAQYVDRLLEDGFDERWGAQITTGSAPYLDVYPADIILLHIGTNDITHGEGNATGDIVNILNRIDEWEASSGTHVVVFLAQILLRTDSPANNTITRQYNDNLAALLASRGDPTVILVDIESGAGINYNSEMMADGIHPAQSAYDKMGSKWYSSLHSYLSSIPASPDGLSAGGASATSIQLTWNDNSNNESGFEIERSKTSDPGSFSLIHTGGPGTGSYTDDGLDENTQYYYRVRAFNASGPSLYTSTEGSTTLSGALEAPGGLLATAMGESSIGIVWTDNSTSETAFLIERSQSSGSGFTEIQTTQANVNSYVDRSLTDGREYFYRVRATNGAVYSNYSQEASAFTELSAPTALSAGTVDEASIHLVWTDNSVSESAYSIERSESSVSGYGVIFTTTANASSYTDTGLPDGKRYYYRIRAAKADLYSAYTSVANAFTPLAAPTGLIALSLDESTIGLEWTDNSVSESGYLIERSEDLGSSYKVIGVVAANTVSYTDEGLVNGSQFVYRVRATSGSNYSVYSNPASAGANLSAPSGLLAQVVDATRIEISWTDESFSETAYIIERSESSGTGFSGIHAVSANVTSYEDSGLRDGRTYYYRVFATNGSLNSEYSNEASATTRLASPTGLTATSKNEESIDLVWTDNSLSESGYRIERSGNPDSGFTELESTPADVETYTDNGLADGSTYYYRIRASQGGSNSEYSNRSGATTKLAAPSGLTALSLQEGVVNLTWEDNSVSETAYIIERSATRGSGYAEIFIGAADAISHTDRDADGRDSYFYRIRATNGILFSDYCHEVQAARSIPLSDSLFSFYPNPNQGQITLVIRRNSEDISDAYLRLIDFSGRVHYTLELELPDGKQVEVFEIKLPPAIKNGFYSLTLITGTRTISEKFVLLR
jgi:fibronectin type 3 domain-containing protein/lysophospholipase L1-like esterase